MKAEERLRRYGKKAYAKMRGLKGKKAIKEIERLSKHKEVPLEIPSKAPYISRAQRSYWKDVKMLSKERKINIKESRRLLKKEKTARNVQVRVIKRGKGWQLTMNAIYEHMEEDGKRLPKPFEREEQGGNSYVHYEESFFECYEEAFQECVADAIVSLGGSGWVLIKILKETWTRYYGREQYLTKTNKAELKEHEEEQKTKSKEGKERRSKRQRAKGQGLKAKGQKTQGILSTEFLQRGLYK